MKVVRYVSLLLSLSLLAFSAFAAESTPAPTKGTVKRFVAVVDPDGVQRVAIIGGDYYFDPNDIVLKLNVPVELTVKKAPGYVPHDIEAKSPEAGIVFITDINAKTPVVIKFTPSKVGKYPLFCSKSLLFFKTHRERGMEGTIEVVE